MIIDCHGHYTTVPEDMNVYRNAQLADLANLSRGTVSEDITHPSRYAYAGAVPGTIWPRFDWKISPGQDGPTP